MNTSDYKIKNIILIGSGNVATHLGASLLNKGYIIKKVWSKNFKNANILAKKLHSIPTDNIKDIKDADLYIVAVSDDAIEQVIKEMEVDNIIHTSGSTSIKVFNKRINNHGVLYPLQTFNKDIKQDLTGSPICIEANNEAFRHKLINIGHEISEKVIRIDSIQRKKLHIAAVFACNFTNHMFSIADKILHQSDMDFKLLLPLIKQTISKIHQNRPSEIQTGPAKRKDNKIIQEHINSLDEGKIKELYSLISKSIMENEK